MDERRVSLRDQADPAEGLSVTELASPVSARSGSNCVLHPALLLLAFTSQNGRDDWIRTSDLLVPNQAHYQAVLHPVFLFFRLKKSAGQTCPAFSQGFK